MDILALKKTEYSCEFFDGAVNAVPDYLFSKFLF